LALACCGSGLVVGAAGAQAVNAPARVARTNSSAETDLIALPLLVMGFTMQDVGRLRLFPYQRVTPGDLCRGGVLWHGRAGGQ
jgi:hypothetical protein